MLLTAISTAAATRDRVRLRSIRNMDSPETACLPITDVQFADDRAFAGQQRHDNRLTNRADKPLGKIKLTRSAGRDRYRPNDHAVDGDRQSGVRGRRAVAPRDLIDHVVV